MDVFVLDREAAASQNANSLGLSRERFPNVRVGYYDFNAFVIEGHRRTIRLDPGQDLHWRRLNSRIPRRSWPSAGLVLVTHGDADHAEYVAQVAEASGALIVCGPALAERWRRKGLNAVPVARGQTAEAAGIPVQGILVRHGGLAVTLIGRSFSFKPASVGEEAVGLLFGLEERRLPSLGDTLLLGQTRRGLRPDVLMVPIGGMMTMDIDDAPRAMASIDLEACDPVHSDWDIQFYHRPANATRLRAAVRAGGRQCVRPKPGESAEI
jgi:L-ascorbate metabolism protein UlaG (beta-lactamase superfamily)